MNWPAQDFIEYWSAFAVARQGGNPYSAVELLPVQQALDPFRSVALMMWVPPWILLLGWPILSLPYLTATKIWLIINVALFFVLIWQTTLFLKFPGKSLQWVVPAALVFAPAWSCIEIGQISLVTSLGVVLLARGLAEGRLAVLSIAAVLLSLKPHVAYLVLLIGGFQSIRMFRPLQLAGALAPLICLAVLSDLFFPGSTGQWLQAFLEEEPGKIKATSWISATLTGQLRLLLRDEHGTPLWPSIVVPGVSACMFGWVLVSGKLKINWRRDLKWLVICSYITSPLAWFFDQSVLIVTQVGLVAENWNEPRGKLLVFLLAAINLAVLMRLHASAFQVQHHQLFWLPLVYLFAILLARPRRALWEGKP